MNARTSLRRCGERVVTWCALTTLGIVCLISTRAQAVPIYAYDNLSQSHHGTNGDRLIRFDSANPNGTMTLIGPSGIVGQGFSGLDFAGDGVLYGVTGFGNNSGAFAGSKLYTVNTNTGAATLVGDVFTFTQEAATDLSWNPQSHQMQMITYDGVDNFLYNVDVTNFAIEPLGRITGLPSGALLVGLSTDSNGVNYVHDVTSDRMYRLNGTAAVAMSAALGFNTNYSQGMTINWGESNDWYLGSQGPAVAANGLFQINGVTGAVQATLATWPTNATFNLPEFETGDLAIIPEPSLSVVALGAALSLWSRRRA